MFDVALIDLEHGQDFLEDALKDGDSFLVVWHSGTPSATERAGRTDLFMTGRVMYYGPPNAMVSKMENGEKCVEKVTVCVGALLLGVHSNR